MTDEDAAKNLLVYAVIGVGFPSYSLADEMTRLGFAKFTGNQHNESWQWDQGKLEALSLDQLAQLFRKCLEIKNVRKGGRND